MWLLVERFAVRNSFRKFLLHENEPEVPLTAVTAQLLTEGPSYDRLPIYSNISLTVSVLLHEMSLKVTGEGERRGEEGWVTFLSISGLFTCVV